MAGESDAPDLETLECEAEMSRGGKNGCGAQTGSDYNGLRFTN